MTRQGIGLCNLVTTIVVEFNKVVEEEEALQKTLRCKGLGFRVWGLGFRVSG